MRWFAVCAIALVSALAGGCATSRTLTISTKPADAIIKVDRIEMGKGPKTVDFVFDASRQTHVVVASRMGFKDTPVTLKEDSPEFERKHLRIELLPQTRKVTINTNMPAIISIDGKAVSNQPLTSYQTELQFSITNSKNEWQSYEVKAERPGFETDTRTIENADLVPTYDLELKPHHKDITVKSNVPGAKIFFEGKEISIAPAKIPDVPFPYDGDTGEYKKYEIRAERLGYDPFKRSISWDDGVAEYDLDLAPRVKTVRIMTDPPGAKVMMDGKAVAKDDVGIAVLEKLEFKPNEKGELTPYTVDVSMRSAQSEWSPKRVPIGWDNGQVEYEVKLKEIVTRKVDLIVPVLQRGSDGWEMVPKTITTTAAKDVTEGGKESPVQVTQFENGTMLDTLAVSPDGARLVYSILQSGTTTKDFRSRIELINTDGTGGRITIDDGQSLDLTPAFTPSGDQIVYASNRGGRRMNVIAVSANGKFGVTNLTTGDSNDLWPCVDSEPRQRLYYQGMVDSREDARIYMTQLNTIFKTDLPLGGTQPRVSPRNDSIVFTRKNEKSGLRDLWWMTDKGTDPRNLTDTPNVEEFDAAWNRDGSKVAFASDRGLDEDGNRQVDIWVMDVAHPESPKRITANASVDDCPAWDPSGSAIYFRSNRGGSWQIWKIAVR